MFSPNMKENTMKGLIKIPKRFFDDHCDRDLDTPIIIKQTARHYWIDKNDLAIGELKSDAEYYVTMGKLGGFSNGLSGLVHSASATLKCLI